MGGPLGPLTSRQLERLKSELAEVIIANFCYPAFLDYRLNMLRTRPVDRRKRQEVWSYVNSVNFGSLGAMDVASMDFRRFVERIFLRYIDMNRALISMASPRQVAAVRARVPQLAANVARGMADYLALGEASAFGRARLVESWAATHDGFREPTWEQIEKSTQLLQTTLVYLRTAGAAEAHPDRALPPDISAMPTRVLAPANAQARLASAGAANGAPSSNQYASAGYRSNNDAHDGANERAPQPPRSSERVPGGRTQYQGPSRLPSITRPVDRTLAAQPAMPSGEGSGGQQEAPHQPVQPAPASHPALAAQPAPAPPSGAAPDAWQALLAEGDAGPSDLDLPDLPASFETPRQFDLPPDLAELYGDYLRDSRAARLDLTVPAQEPNPADALSAALPHAETDEEVDALFNALTSHIAVQEQAAQAAAAHQQASYDSSEETNSSGAGALQHSGALGAERASQPPSSARAEQEHSSGRAKGVTDGDVMIFSQLQHQISTWVKMAAVSHQIDLVGRDAAELVAELRRTAALEEAELQVIESLVALCHRVTTTKQATMEDYKQAMMLYLLHHRSRLAL